MKKVGRVLGVVLALQVMSSTVFASEEKVVKQKEFFGANKVYEIVQKPTSKRLSIDKNNLSKEIRADLQQLSKMGYLVPKTNKKFEVVVSIKKGTYTFVKATDSYEDALKTAKALKPSKGIPAIINGNGLVVYATNGIGKVVKVVDGKVYTGIKKTTLVYHSSDLLSKNLHTSIHPSYIDDVPVVAHTGTKAKIEIDGYTGWVNADPTKNEFDLVVIPLNQFSNPSYYEVNAEGLMSYFISSNLEATVKQGNWTTIGPAPTYLKKGIYYSYDGNYFYHQMSSLIADSKAGNHQGAINKTAPFYNYYQYVSARSKTVFTATQLNSFITNRLKEKGKTDSKLQGIGQSLLQAQQQYGVNALLMLGVAFNESDYGTSRIARENNNIFNIDAIDANPDNARKFDTVAKSINYFAQLLLSAQYSNPTHEYYHGAYLGNKASGFGVKYAADPFWGKKSAYHAFVADYHLANKKISSLKEYNRYSLAVIRNQGEVYNQQWSKLYEITKDDIGQVVTLQDDRPLTYNKVNWYKVNPNITSNNGFDGTYDWNVFGYMKSANLQLLYNKDRLAPKVSGVAHNKYYKKDVILSFNEGTATLNNKTITSGVKVSKAGTYTLKVIDQAGNTTNLTFTLDKTAPNAPTVKAVNTKSTAVTGTAEKGSIVYVYKGKTKVGTATTNNKGIFHVSIKTQKKGTNLTVYAVDKATNQSKSVIITVK